MPKTLQGFKDSMTLFEELWQFPSVKEYHNFKNFYSIVVMAIVDAKDRLCVGKQWLSWE